VLVWALLGITSKQADYPLITFNSELIMWIQITSLTALTSYLAVEKFVDGVEAPENWDTGIFY
jgi:hypothetical protein